MRFFKSQESSFSLAWYDGQVLHDSLSIPNASNTRLIVLVSAQETRSWTSFPNLGLLQRWQWRQAQLYRYKQLAVTGFVIKPVVIKLDSKNRLLKQSWQPLIPPSLDVVNKQTTKKGFSKDFGLFSFDQWWQAWWPITPLQQLLDVDRSQPSLWVIHLELDQIAWLQIAHFQGFAYCWRVLQPAAMQQEHQELMRFIDFLADDEQAGMTLPKPSGLIKIDNKHYAHYPFDQVANNAELFDKMNEKGLAQLSESQLLHNHVFGHRDVLKRLRLQKPAYYFPPWSIHHRLWRWQRRLKVFNSLVFGLLLFVGLGVVKFGWHKVDEPILSRISEVSATQSSVDISPSFTPKQRHDLSRVLEQWQLNQGGWQAQSIRRDQYLWSFLTEFGFKVTKLAWYWHEDGYWLWQIRADIGFEKRHELSTIMAHFKDEVANLGRIEQWQQSLQGLDAHTGRLPEPGDIKLEVEWSWQQWP